MNTTPDIQIPKTEETKIRREPSVLKHIAPYIHQHIVQIMKTAYVGTAIVACLQGKTLTVFITMTCVFCWLLSRK